MVIQRGQIWWAELPEPLGAGPGYRRPVLVVQTDSFNRSRISTVIALIITSNLRLAAAPGNILLTPKTSGLPKESVVNASQIVTLDKSFLTVIVTTLPARLMQQIDDCMRLVLEL